MEDEDEVTQEVQEQASMADEIPLKEKEEQTEVLEQCGVVLTAGESSEGVVAAVVEREEDAVEKVEESKFEGAKMEKLAFAVDDDVKGEENVEVSISEGAEVMEDGVRVEEVENVEELKFEGVEMDELGVAGDDGCVRMEDASILEGAEEVDDGLRVEEMAMEKEKEKEEGQNCVENFEVSKSKGAVLDVGGGEMVGVGDDEVKMEETEVEKGGVEEEGRNDRGIEIAQELKAELVDDGEVKTLELEMKVERMIDNENVGEQGSREGEVHVDVDEGLGIGGQAEGEEQEGDEGAEKGEVMLGGDEGAKKVEAMLGEEGCEGAKKGEVMLGEGGSEGAEKGEVMLGEGGGEATEKRELMLGEEGSVGAEKGEIMLDEEGFEGAEKGEGKRGEGAEEGEKVLGEEGGEGTEEEEVEGEEEGQGEEMDDSEATGDGEVSPRSPVVAEEEEVSKEEETPIADTEMVTESEVIKSESGSGGKRRRGRNPKASTPVKVPARKTVGEDVCFICLDGGDLVLCDRRFVCFFIVCIARLILFFGGCEFECVIN